MVFYSFKFSLLDPEFGQYLQSLPKHWTRNIVKCDQSFFQSVE